jgi:hypothetical protein
MASLSNDIKKHVDVTSLPSSSSPVSSKISKNNNTTIVYESVRVSGLKPSSKLVYFAAKGKPFYDFNIYSRKEVYDSPVFTIIRSKPDGTAILRFPYEFPQVYYVNSKKNKVLPRHIHYAYASSEGSWGPTLETIPIIANKTTLETKIAIQIQSHIYISDQDANVTVNMKQLIMSKLSQMFSPQLRNLVSSKKLNWKHVPIISNSLDIHTKLEKIGVVNTWISI